MSDIICKKISDCEYYHKAKNVCFYMPINNEVDLTLLFNSSLDLGKKIWLPKVEGTYMNFYYYDNSTSFIQGSYGIREPDTQIKLTPDKDTLVVMPGAVFSKKCDRIGYGGGFYDKYLETYPFCKKIAVCYDFQVVEDIPSESYDVKPDIIISERAIYSSLK